MPALAGIGTALKSSKLLAGVAAAIVAAVAGIAVITAATLTSNSAAADPCNTGGGPGSGTELVSQEPSEAAVADIPGDYLEVYQSAADEYGLDWAILAGIGSIESDHGRADGGSCAEGPSTPYGTAKGPMQFIDSTWETAGVDGNGDGQANVCDFEDAIPAAAGYLRDGGAPDDYYAAIYSYNYADWYVQEVLARADEYRAASGGSEDGPGHQASSDTGLLEQAQQAPGLASLAAADISGAAADLVSRAGASAAAPFQMRAAGAEAQGWDLVDSGRNLHYEDYTAYDSALDHAVGVWNNLGSIAIEPSPGGGETDAYVGDSSSMSAMGYTQTSDESITFNPQWMDPSTQNGQNAAAAHEFGHALGLGHTSNPSVMNSPVMIDRSDNHETPTDDDEHVYYGIWGEPSSTNVSDDRDGPPTGQVPSNLVFPVSGDAYTYMDDWGMARPGGRTHEGTDIMTAEGTPLLAIVAGTIQASSGSNSNNYSDVGGYNIMIEATEAAGPIEPGDMMYYAHMTQPPEVQIGQSVRAGDVIGHVGNTGYGPEVTRDMFEPHLHLGWYDVSGARAEAASGAMNPYPLLQAIEQGGGTLNTGNLAPAPCGDPGSSDTNSGPTSDSSTEISSTGPDDAPASEVSTSSFSNQQTEKVVIHQSQHESDYDASAETSVSADASPEARTVIDAAAGYLGAPYRPGGDSLEGIDAPGLTMRAYAAAGVRLPHWDDEQAQEGTRVSRSELQPADLVFFTEPAPEEAGENPVTHVALYLGDGRILHSSSAYGQTVIGDITDVSGYLEARRLL